MAATRTAEVRPNGSAHLADHAATAALYVTDPMRKRAGSETVSREMAKNESTVTPGLTLANASAAASLAHANRKTTAPWRPAERQPYAEKAAAFVRSYQTSGVQETSSAAATKTPHPDVYKAALLAAQDRVYSTSSQGGAATGGVATGTAATTSTSEPRYDQAAFEHAMSSARRDSRERRSSTTAQINPGALTAATGAVVSGRRRRTESAPTNMFHPDAAYALTAATISHRASQVDPRDNVLTDIDPGLEASRIHHIAQANAQMYTATPPIEIEVEEQKHKDTLRAAAISMAKDMYATTAARDERDGSIDYASSAAQNRLSHRYSQSQFSWLPGDEYNMVQRSPNLHEAAQKIANEKLARMQQNELQNKQQYYGVSSPKPSRQTFTRRLTRRTSSEGDASKMDWETSEQIRHQMSSLQTRLHQIDEKKSRDRADLMEIARKNVHAAIHDMDEKVYASTGKPSPNMQREWEEKAHERALQDSEARMTGFGRVSVGGQKYMDQSEVDAIARSRIQPTLDEISIRVEEQKAREVEERLEQERQQRLQELDRERERDIQAEEKKAATSEKGKDGMIRRRSTKGRGSVFSRPFLRRKTAEGAVNGVVVEEQTQNNHQPLASPRSEQREQPARTGLGVVNAPTSPAEQPVDRAAEQNATETARPAQQPEVTDPVDKQQTSPKSGSKLGGWFRGRLSRRFSKPPPPEEKPEDIARDTPTREGAAAPDAVNGYRAAPLTSNPVTATDFAAAPATTAAAAVSEPGADQDIGHEGVMRQWSSSTENTNPDRNHRWSTNTPPPADQQQGQDGGSGSSTSRRHRIRLSLLDMMNRKSSSEHGSTISPSSPKASPTSPTSAAAATTAAGGSGAGGKALGTSAVASSSARPAATSRMNTMERNELHDTFAEESLPPPPGLFHDSSRRSVSSSARDSKFSEDL